MKTKKETPNTSRFPPLDEILDSETREFAKKYRKEQRKGKIPKTPRKSHCRVLKDLSLYVCRRVQVNGEYCMSEAAGGIRTWVWFGHDFNDRIVDIVQEVVPQLSDKGALRELRLVATRVSAVGILRLNAVFPSAQVMVYTDDDHQTNWELSQASFQPQARIQ